MQAVLGEIVYSLAASWLPTAKIFSRQSFMLLALRRFFTGGSANAGVPTEQVRVTVDQVIAILQDPSLKPESKQKENAASNYDGLSLRD